MKSGDKFTGKELADFLHTYEDKHMQKIEGIEKKVDKLTGDVQRLFGVLREVAKKLDVNREAMKLIGEQRIDNCIYSRNGYCEHITQAIPESELSEESRSTTQKDGRYYPHVRWIDCYLCTKCQVPPS